MLFGDIPVLTGLVKIIGKIYYYQQWCGVFGVVLKCSTPTSNSAGSNPSKGLKLTILLKISSKNLTADLSLQGQVI
jgi:hypothetical protein